MSTQTKGLSIQERIDGWEPYPQKIQVGRFLVKLDGKNLPNSVTEDIGGFSLCPKYSAKQRRRINRIQMRKVKDRYRNVKSISRGINHPITKQSFVRRWDNQEVGI
jgi:hypothetical protein